jgi:hypothetical protein
VRLSRLFRRTHRRGPKSGRLALLPQLSLRVEGLDYQWAGLCRINPHSPARTGCCRAEKQQSGSARPWWRRPRWLALRLEAVFALQSCSAARLACL